MRQNCRGPRRATVVARWRFRQRRQRDRRLGDPLLLRNTPVKRVRQEPAPRSHHGPCKSSYQHNRYRRPYSRPCPCTRFSLRTRAWRQWRTRRGRYTNSCLRSRHHRPYSRLGLCSYFWLRIHARGCRRERSVIAAPIAAFQPPCRRPKQRPICQNPVS